MYCIYVSIKHLQKLFIKIILFNVYYLVNMNSEIREK